MSLSLKEILTQMAHTVGRAHLIEHIDALPWKDAETEGETEAEKLAKQNPLTADEASLLARLKARQDAIDHASDAKPEPEADDKPADTGTEDASNGHA